MEELILMAEKVVNHAIGKGIVLTTAESATGGLVSYAITAVPGASDIFDQGFVTYSNESKVSALNVSKNTLNTVGSVSERCAEEMVMGAMRNSRAQLAVSITGIAGPGGATPTKPVGLVYFGYYDKKLNLMRTEERKFEGDRYNVRLLAAKRAMELFMEMLHEN